ncbi:MAG TPA: hypothetical protein P5568_12350 [Acidobacteriota bacterium]|nr:hypothetical protein [Acidobacteriota bacterium]
MELTEGGYPGTLARDSSRQVRWIPGGVGNPPTGRSKAATTVAEFNVAFGLSAVTLVGSGIITVTVPPAATLPGGGCVIANLIHH